MNSQLRSQIFSFVGAGFATFAITTCLCVSPAQAAKAKAKETTKDVVYETPVNAKTPGNADAPQGGTFIMNMKAEPSTLNPITGTDLYNQVLQTYVLDNLMERDPNTYEFVPSLAEKMVASADGKTFTFTLRQGLKWSDGKPLTVDDVKFSFDVIFDAKYNAAHLRPYYENIEKAEIVDANTIRFTVKDTYFKNLEVIAGLTILPKHFYGDADAGLKKNKTILGSGAYKLESYNQGQSLVLVKNKEWFGAKLPYKKGQWNFERIRIRFYKDNNSILEALKKGDLDSFDDITPETYEQQMVGPEFGKSVIKEKVENSTPKDFSYIGWNLKRELFKDKNVRIALAELMNREEMIKLYRFNMSFPATGPWYQKSEYADPTVKAIQFDPKKAVELLKKSGYALNGEGILEKTVNGHKQPLQFTLTYGNKDTEKYYVLYQNDLRKVGVKMDLQLLEWNALLKNMDSNNFDAVALRWGGGSVDLDPKQVWGSSSAGKGGSNFISYSNPEVDKLIDQARTEMDKKKRIPILRKVYRLIAEDAPYVFMFNDKFTLYANTSRVKKVKPTYKFDVGTSYWWIQP